MSPRMMAPTLLAALALTDCARSIPPPCQGAQCQQWPHVTLNFWRNQTGRERNRYTAALCVQVSFDCPEEGRHEVWIEPQHPRCRPYLNYEGPEWLRVERGQVSIPWPARCQGRQVEMYVTAQPNFAICSAVNNRMVLADRQSLTADLAFDCR